MRLVVALLFAAAAASGGELLKKEVFGAVGIGKTYDDEGSLGAGLNGGGGFGYRLSHRFGVEAEVNAFRTRREFSPVFPAYQAHGTHAMGNGLLYFNRGAAQAYLIFGAGVLHFRNQADFAGSSAGRSGNGFAANAGFGVRIFATQRVSLRPEFRVYAGGAGGAVEAPFGDMRLSLGIGYHW